MTWGQIPEGIRYLAMDAVGPGAMNALPGQFPEHGADMSMIRLQDQTYRLPSNRWSPKLWMQGGLIAVYTAFDWETQTFAKDPETGLWERWENMVLGSKDAKAGPDAYRAYTGADAFDLLPNWVGVIVWQKMSIHEPEKAEYGLEVYFPKDSTWFGKGRQQEARRGRKDKESTQIETLTNSEGAILWIYSKGTSRKGAPKLALNKRKELMDELNLGTNDSVNNPTLKGLVDRGFFRLPERAVSRSDGKVIREIPIITDKGHAHAPDMEPSVFEGAFKREVMASPDAPLMMGDFQEWIGDETEQGQVMDVGEMAQDKRPEWQRIMEDRK